MPVWKQLMTAVERGDELIITKFSNAIRGSRELAAFLEFCRIKVIKLRSQYGDLMAKYENPIEHTCDVCEGMSWISVNGQCPDGMCPEAWKTMKEFVEALARGEGLCLRPELLLKINKVRRISTMVG